MSNDETTTTTADIIELCDIKSFLDKFATIVSLEDIEQLRSLDTKIDCLRKKKQIINRYGLHYDDCIWSTNKITGETEFCDCYNNSISQLERKALNIINVYYFILGE